MQVVIIIIDLREKSKSMKLHCVSHAEREKRDDSIQDSVQDI